MPLKFIGLDFETSDNTLVDWDASTREIIDAGSRAIQIGISLDIKTTYCSYIGNWDSKMVWSQRAQEVHNIPREVVDEAPPAGQVDNEIVDWLTKHLDFDPTTSRSLVAVGWNVGAYDLPYAHHALPRTHGLLSRRTIDLNAVCYSMDKIFEVDGGKVGYKTLKRTSKLYAIQELEKMGFKSNAHDAGWDAQAALLCLDYLRSVQMGIPFKVN